MYAKWLDSKRIFILKNQIQKSSVEDFLFNVVNRCVEVNVKKNQGEKQT